jgi:hypothetical protein
MPAKTDRGVDGDNKYIAAQGRNAINSYSAVGGEDGADAAVIGSQGRPLAPGSVGNRPVLPGGSQGARDAGSVLSRPYHGDWRGRLENRAEDPADGAQLAKAQVEEGKLIASRADQYANHGNIGFSGNYPIDWEVER